MMTRVFLAAGVAALAITAPASAEPHGGGKPNVVVNRGGPPRVAAPRMQARAFAPARMQRPAFAAPRVQRQAFAGPRMQRFAAPRPQRFAAPRMQRFAARPPQRVAMMRQQRAYRMAARPQMRMAARQQMRMNRAPVHSRMAARQQMRMNRAPVHSRMAARQQMRLSRIHAQNRMAATRQGRATRIQQARNLRASRGQFQNRMAMRQQLRANRMNPAQNRMAMRQQLRPNRMNPAQNRMATRQQMQGNRFNQPQNRMAMQPNRLNQAQNRMAMRQQFQGNGMNQGQSLAMRQQAQANRQPAMQTLLAQRRALLPDRIGNADLFPGSRFATLAALPRATVVDPVQAVQFVGQPVSAVTNYVQLAPLPASISYLYPPTPNYYYEYGGGYLYQVDRTSSLIDALIPLLAGGFMPGTYLPASYMSSYVPNYYGLNSFYPAYYGNTCNRYAYGVVYEVDCATGLVQDVVPIYAGGYGVGQVLPSAYSYYNVPMQYRSMYYPTADASYWYAPGAIYQYDPASSVITSVAALMAPGFTVGQPLPTGYDMYNVPLAYRSTYYDTPTAWYRYNNGYIYQVDPTTMLVTSVVASLLT